MGSSTVTSRCEIPRAFGTVRQWVASGRTRFEKGEPFHRSARAHAHCKEKSHHLKVNLKECPSICTPCQASNVLLDSLLHAKVCDFGLIKAHLYSNVNDNHTIGVGTVRYIPPEVMGHFEPDLSTHSTSGGGVGGPAAMPLLASYSCMCDVYSFGLMLWEMMHQALVFEHLSGHNVAIRVMTQGLRPPIELRPDRECFGELIEACGRLKARARPRMSECAEQLRHILLAPELIASMEPPPWALATKAQSELHQAEPSCSEGSDHTAKLGGAAWQCEPSLGAPSEHPAETQAESLVLTPEGSHHTAKLGGAGAVWQCETVACTAEPATTESAASVPAASEPATTESAASDTAESARQLQLDGAGSAPTNAGPPQAAPAADPYPLRPSEGEEGIQGVVLEVQLGHGGFATVWSGRWMHSRVAVKVFRVTLRRASEPFALYSPLDGIPHLLRLPQL